MSVKNQTFIQKIFSCCMNHPQNEEDNEIKSNFPSVKNSLNFDDSNLIFSKKYIRQDEINKITFTEEGIKNFIDDLTSLNYVEKFKNEDLKISQADSSIINQNIFNLRCEATKPKSLFKNKVPSLKEIRDAIYNPEQRLEWDKNTKSIDILEQFNDNTSIVKSITQKILAIISERELIEKRYEYYIGDNEYYNFASSIPDEIYSPQSEPIRCTTYISVFIIKEDENNFIFDSFNQIDIKLNVSQTLITISFPIKMKEFFNKLIDYINKKNE